MWAFGVLLWELAANGQSPHGELDQAAVMVLIANGQLLARPDGCSELFYSLMLRCWAQQPSERPTMEALTALLHAVFFKLGQLQQAGSTSGVVRRDTLRRSTTSKQSDLAAGGHRRPMSLLSEDSDDTLDT